MENDKLPYGWLDAHCLSKPGAARDFKQEWNATRYMVGGRLFLMRGGDAKGRAIVTLKLEPSEGEFLRGQYPDIIPGYYMNKQHWYSVYLDGVVPDEVLRVMIVCR